MPVGTGRGFTTVATSAGDKCLRDRTARASRRTLQLNPKAERASIVVKPNISDHGPELDEGRDVDFVPAVQPAVRRRDAAKLTIPRTS